jgi:phosphoenolpyruvate carboxykinase (ATP)
VWLLNTGWTGGPYGEGTRIDLAYTRAMITAALEGKLHGAATEKEAVFGFAIPTAVPGVPAAILNPRNTWADGAAYDAKARYLAQLFRDNFEPYVAGTDAVIQAAAPRL